ncbi:MAG: ABC transporter substrate-binding protein [Micrococcaceae bacterium]|nr:ABC transporter substrate-binding protein [Micrococcaceae bacterium]
MKTSTPKSLIATLALLSIGLTACSGSSDAAQETPAENQTFTVAPNSFPVTLDQHSVSAEAAVFSPMQHVMQPLVVRGDNDANEVEPGLAQSWELVDDTTWRFNIHPDAEFSDGTPVTSADAAASIQRILDFGGGLAPLLEPITTMDTSDDKVLLLETETPLGTLLNTLSLVLIGPADQMDDEAFWEQPIGSGPFEVENFTVDQELVLSSDEDWWGDQDIALDELVFRSMPEQSSRLSALANNEVDLVTGITADATGEVEAMDGVEFEKIPSMSYRKLWFNSSVEPFTDPNVRRAMWHAVDVESIVKDLFGEDAMVAKAPIPQTAFGAPELEQYEYDPEYAQELLAEAGYPDGFETSIQYTDGDGTPDSQLAQAFISAWDEIGVTVNAQPKERAVFLEDFGNADYDMNLMGNSVATGDADYTLGRLYLCADERNGYCNEELDDLLNQAKAELDQDVRKDLYHEASEIIWDEAVGIFPMDSTEAYAYSDHIQDLDMDPAARHDYFSVSVNEQ